MPDQKLLSSPPPEEPALAPDTEFLLDVRVRYGLTPSVRAQVQAGLDRGEGWDLIARAVGWHQATLEQHWAWAVGHGVATATVPPRPSLTNLRTLLARAPAGAGNPALLRLPKSERTVEGLARAYLPREIWSVVANGIEAVRPALILDVDLFMDEIGDRAIHVHEVATGQALLTALTLSLGRDPGVGGFGVRWTRVNGMAGPGSGGWCLTPLGLHTQIFFAGPASFRWASVRLAAPIVAAELDPIKALVLAVLHVLEAP